MIGNLVGAAVGKRFARRVSGSGGRTGAVLGASIPFLLRRMGPMGFLATVAGGYALKRFSRKR